MSVPETGTGKHNNKVENYFKAIVMEEGSVQSESTPITDSLRGSYNAPKDFDYKKELTKSLTEKYL